MHKNLWLAVLKSGGVDRDGQNFFLTNILRICELKEHKCSEKELEI